MDTAAHAVKSSSHHSGQLVLLEIHSAHGNLGFRATYAWSDWKLNVAAPPSYKLIQQTYEIHHMIDFSNFSESQISPWAILVS